MLTEEIVTAYHETAKSMVAFLEDGEALSKIETESQLRKLLHELIENTFPL